MKNLNTAHLFVFTNLVLGRIFLIFKSQIQLGDFSNHRFTLNNRTKVLI